MALPPITFRTTGTGTWGTGKGSRLTTTEIDQNFYRLQQDIEAAAESAAAPIAIESIDVTGSQMTITLSDATVFGPFTLPKAKFNYRGEWTDGESYGINDIVKVTNDGVYMVARTHVAADPFDPELLDGAIKVYEPLMPAAEQAVRQYENRTGTSDTPVINDRNKLLRMTNDAGCTVTIPPDVFAVNDELYFVQRGTSPVTFVAGVGVTFLANDIFDLETAGRGATVMFKHVSGNTWERTGQFLLLP
jgi:hypothetical protein